MRVLIWFIENFLTIFLALMVILLSAFPPQCTWPKTQSYAFPVPAKST